MPTWYFMKLKLYWQNGRRFLGWKCTPPGASDKNPQDSTTQWTFDSVIPILS